MQRRWSYLIGILLTAAGLACGSASPAPSAPTPPGPALVRVSVGDGTQDTATGSSRQLHAYAQYSNFFSVEVTNEASWRTSNPVVATISNTGVLTTWHEGDVDVLAVYQGIEGAWRIFVRTSLVPPGRGDLIGSLYEAAPMEDVAIANARVTISGGEYDGRWVEAPYGVFRFLNIFSAGFDLVASSPGYQTRRYRIAELPRDASPRITLEPDPWIVSEVFEAPCSSTSTNSRFFTPAQSGLFRINRAYGFGGDTEGFGVKLLANGVVIVSSRDVLAALQGGTTYELRVDCYPPVTFRVNYLRPR